MIASFFSIHSYLLLNGAIAVGYLISRCILSFSKNSLHAQHLKFARYSFCAAIALFFIVPMLLKIFPSVSYSSFQLQPILKNASHSMVNAYIGRHEPIELVASTETLLG